MLNRRQFVTRSVTLAVVAPLATTALLETEGCNVNVKALVNSLIASSLAIIKVASPNAPWLPALTSAVAALQQAEQAWANGGSIVILQDALATIEAVVAAIPQTVQYAPLIAVIVAGINSVLAVIAPTPAVSAMMAKPNPYRGMVAIKKPHLFQTTAGAYRQQWNDTCKRIGLPQAEI